MVATQAQFAGPVGAIFWHLPGLRLDVVQGVPLWQTLPLFLVAHGPAATSPTLCKRPGKPLNLSQIPAYATAVNAVTITPATTRRTNAADKALRISLD